MIIISGPTGVGKSDLALSIAERINGDIINIDVGQLYTPCTIGTAKPDWQNSPIKHYLFDYADTPRDITVVEYREAADNVIRLIQAKGHKPCFVGGSGFYISSLFFPPQQVITEVEPEQIDYEVSWNELERIDPQRARVIKPTDIYRIGRALALYYSTGQLPSSRKPIYAPLREHAVIILLTRDRADLYQRINERVEIMFQHGWVEEVRSLVGTAWQPFLMKKKLIGYDDIFRALAHNTISGDALVHLKQVIAQKTRHYAKRQETFWRMLKKNLHAASPTSLHVHEINLSDADAAAHALEEIMITLDTMLYS